MKLKKFVMLAMAGILSLTTSPVFAKDVRESFDNNAKVEETLFYNLKETDKVIELEDGGFLYGSATITDENDPDFEPIEYNSLTDPNSITVKEARTIIKDESNSNFSRGANVPDSSTKTVTLGANGAYQSSAFSGTGWRFGGKSFKAADSTGTYLRWTSKKDGGRVGNYSEAVGTKNGSLQGTIIEKDQTQYVSRGGSGMIYYTYSPAAGTTYYVINA